jgi:2-dehydro-3-deoxy-D-gluconate 5-dehydrogenase
VQDLGDLNPRGARMIVDACVEHLGGLDILVNNAGIISRRPALEFEQQEWEDTLAINLSSAFYLSQAAARQFVDRGEGGKIVNVASLLSFQGGILVPAYAATKSGLAGLTKALANEWAERDINVNAVAPGYMATEVTTAIRADTERSQSMLERIPAGRWGEPDDVKGAVVFLASEAARYVHGITLPVDGGWLAR